MRRFVVPAAFALATVALVATSPANYSVTGASDEQVTVLTPEAPEAVFDVRTLPGAGTGTPYYVELSIAGTAHHDGPSGDPQVVVDGWIEAPPLAFDPTFADAGEPSDAGEPDAGDDAATDAGTPPDAGEPFDAGLPAPPSEVDRLTFAPGVSRPFELLPPSSDGAARVHFRLRSGLGPVTLRWKATARASISVEPAEGARLDVFVIPVE